VNLALAAVALAVVLGGVLAVSARTPRVAVFGLIVVMVGSPLLADPLPDSLALAIRIVGAILAGELLWIAVRGHDARTEGSRLGWPAEALLAAAGAAVGFGSYGLGAQASGPMEAQTAGFALAALAIVPVANGRDTVRIGLGLNLLTAGALLVAAALGGTPIPAQHVVLAVLVVAVGGTTAAISFAVRGDGGFELGDERGDRRHRPADAHPAESR
jgi:hypothetical protein